MKKTYICFEPGEQHPALCVVEKRSEIVGRMNPEVVMKYEVQSLEALPAGMPHIDMQEMVKTPHSESESAEDDDCDLALCMAVWYAAQDTEQTRGKNIPGLL